MKRKIATFIAAAGVSAGLLAEGVLLVVPANQSLVELGFDLMRMKPAGAVEMICYAGADEVQSLEFFDRSQWRWQEIPQTTWINGTLRDAARDALVIVGDSQAAADLLDTASWADNILTPSGHSFHEVANALHSATPLTRKQWMSLGKNYGITYREIKAPSRYERRSRYDRGDTRAAATEITQQLPPEVDLQLRPTEVIVSTPVTDEAPAAEVSTTEEVPVPSAETPAAEAVAPAAPATEESAEAPAVEKPAAAGESAATEEPVAEAVAVEASVVQEPAAAQPETEAPAEEVPERPAEEVPQPAVAAAVAAPAAAVVTAAETAAEAAADEAAAARRTVQEALEKARAEVEGARVEGKTDLEIQAPAVDLGIAPQSVAAPELPAPEPPSTAVKVPEMPLVPAIGQ